MVTSRLAHRCDSCEKGDPDIGAHWLQTGCFDCISIDHHSERLWLDDALQFTVMFTVLPHNGALIYRVWCSNWAHVIMFCRVFNGCLFPISLNKNQSGVFVSNLCESTSGQLVNILYVCWAIYFHLTVVCSTCIHIYHFIFYAFLYLFFFVSNDGKLTQGGSRWWKKWEVTQIYGGWEMQTSVIKTFESNLQFGKHFNILNNYVTTTDLQLQEQI